MWERPVDWTSTVLEALGASPGGENPSDTASERFLSGLGRIFYLGDPANTSFRHPDQVPDFLHRAWPHFLLFIALECVVLKLKRKPTPRLNDTVTSLSNGLMYECGRLAFRGGESLAYAYVHERFRVVDLPWDSALTWYLAALGVDFCYYWVHRASHEVHILWAQHQVHHSSENFNLAVGLRQSVLHGWCGFLLYLPLALVIPPAHFVAHQQFSLLYQFWIHTEAVDSLGPLEYVLNTPKHHRVHHGCNKYCLDRNYGGVLIVWDRAFGTFADERPDEDIVYGLVVNRPSFNPLHLQTFYTAHVARSVAAHSSWGRKVAAVFAGPSWSPGGPRLGEESKKLDIRHRTKYDVRLSRWFDVYLLLHFCAVGFEFHRLAERHLSMGPATVLVSVAYVVGSLTSIGMAFDGHAAAPTCELFRCVAFALATKAYEVVELDVQLLQLFHLTSAIWWCVRGFGDPIARSKQ